MKLDSCTLILPWSCVLKLQTTYFERAADAFLISMRPCTLSDMNRLFLGVDHDLLPHGLALIAATSLEPTNLLYKTGASLPST
jgi:hypothetical protein